MSDHTYFMDKAVQWAHKGGHDVFPNPKVGAIFVKNGKIISQGYHHKYGEVHAEVDAIQKVKDKKSLKGSTLYVTLEPCAHFGKQGPCAKALIKIGIKRVIYAQIDPNPLVAGKGIHTLEKSHIQTQYFSTSSSKRLNEIYTKNTLFQRPFIEIKTALTSNGKITLKKGKRSQLSNEKSNQKTQKLRTHHDAILIGISTLLSDNPRLTIRNPKGTSLHNSPIRIILDSQLKSPPSAQLFKEPGEIILATLQKNSPTVWGTKTTILTCKPDKNGHIDLNDLLKKLFKKSIRSILVEGGEQVNTSFVKSGLADRITLCLTPHSTKDATLPSFINPKKLTQFNLVDVDVEILDNDLWISGNLNLPT